MSEEKPNERIELKRQYIPGSQMWFQKGNFFGRDHNLRGFGCGVVACMDFCVYRGDMSISQNRTVYCSAVREMAHSYFPIMPGLGIAPYYYPVLLNLFFLHRKLPYRVKKVFSAKKTDKVKELLERDLPVILCVGPTIPFLFREKKIRLYRQDNEKGVFMPDRHFVKSHYMTLIGMTEDVDGEIFFKIATWGEILYMKQSDYLAYSKYTFPGTNRLYDIEF